jgi:hypothetical protein
LTKEARAGFRIVVLIVLAKGLCSVLIRIKL